MEILHPGKSHPKTTQSLVVYLSPGRLSLSDVARAAKENGRGGGGGVGGGKPPAMLSDVANDPVVRATGLRARRGRIPQASRTDGQIRPGRIDRPEYRRSRGR